MKKISTVLSHQESGLSCACVGKARRARRLVTVRIFMGRIASSSFVSRLILGTMMEAEFKSSENLEHFRRGISKQLMAGDLFGGLTASAGATQCQQWRLPF